MKSLDGLMQGCFLHEKLNQVDRLTQLISRFMSLPLENRLWPLVRGKHLILLTDDTQFATQARFMQKPLTQYLNEQTELRITRLEIKLMSVPLPKKRRQLSRKTVSTKTADVLSSIASGIEDQELQDALRRLAQIN